MKYLFFCKVLQKAIPAGMAFLLCLPVLSADKAFLWRVDSKTTTVWLFGTVHVGKASFYPLPASVEYAYTHSDRLAVEIDVLQPDIDPISLMKRSLYPLGDSLEKHLGHVNWQKLSAALPVMYGIEAKGFERSKPWMLASVLSMASARQQGFDEAYGIDLHLLKRAHQDGKPITSLESFASQLNALENLSEATQIDWIMSMVDPAENARSQATLSTLVTSWQQGNPDDMAKIWQMEASGKHKPAMNDFELRLLKDRNPAMAAKIVAFLKGKQSVLVAVGALHFAGPANIITLLKRQGLKPVQQLANLDQP
ncbi:TraB/GumN family protein [Leeia oryzae]|uniref:TraB/GumN family protein n=1 Tax=Leeia oryzae TaxID=356662 RepID=UPI000372E4A5|nr:TraB/GumN family protein [Leeia oryzae]